MTKRTSGVVGGNRRRVSGAQAVPPPVTYRLFPSTSGPATGDGYTGPFSAGVCFTVTSAVSLRSYWYWVAGNGDTTAQKWCLWHVTGSRAGTVVPGSTVTGGLNTVGAWNETKLLPPLALTVGAFYIACAGWSVATKFSGTDNSWGPGDIYANGIVNGPLTAYSDVGGGNPVPGSWANQSPFQTVTADPTVTFPANGSNAINLWVDLSVG